MTEDADIVHCHRCGGQSPPPAEVQQSPPLSDEIRGKVCADCWREWQAAEVMVINELHLNFMDPRAGEVLERNLREFLRLDAGPPDVEGS